MPPKPVVSIEGNLRNFGQTGEDIAENREWLDGRSMAEMLYSGFEQKVTELEQRGINLPPPTDMNGNILPGWENYAAQHHQSGGGGMVKVAGSRPPSSSERAITVLMETRDDMLREFSSVSQDPMRATKVAMSIQRIEAQIISLGGEVDRFDPANYQSGLKPVEQAIDPMVAARKVADTTQQAYTLRKIADIRTGTNKAGRAGIAIKIEHGPSTVVHGTVVPRTAFTGDEVIDYVPDSGKGRMTVKRASNGYWKDVSGEFEVNWRIEQVGG